MLKAVAPGARGPKVVEHQVVVKKHLAQWKRPEINLAELVTLRWLKDWSIPRLAAHFNRSPETIQMHCCQMRAGKIDRLPLDRQVREEIKCNMQLKKYFHGH
jgi:hypothetical protein